MKSSARLLAAFLGSLLLSGPIAAQDQEPLVIATASPAGVYHVVGRALCRTLKEPCRAQPTDGSSANLRALQRGELKIALAQSDLHLYATLGTEGFLKDGPDPKLRSIFSLHNEPFSLVVRRDSGIKSLNDITGHSVNIGNPGSGQRGTMLRLMDARGWSRSDFRSIHNLPADQQALELCHGNIDAMVYTVGHPNASVAKAIRMCDAVLVDVEGDTIDLLVGAYPYFTRAWIPADIYGVDQPAVHTFGVKGTLVASADTDPDVVYQLVAAVFEDFARFKASHPALGALTPEEMIRDGLTAPLHEGALRYYREQGWLEEEDMAAVTD